MEYVEPRTPLGKSKNIMTQEELTEFLKTIKYGTVAFLNDGHPDMRPFDMTWEGDGFMIHGAALHGEKLRCFEACNRVCVNAYRVAENIGSEKIATHASVIAYGTIEMLEGDEKIEALRKVSLSAGMPFKAEDAYINPRLKATAAWKIKPEYMTGKWVGFGAQPQ